MKDNLIIDRTIIALALQNKQFAMELSNKITFEYFRSEIQWLYKAITDHFTNPKFREIPTKNVIEEYLRKHYSQAEFITNGIKLFNELEVLEVVQAEFTWYLEKLRVRYNDQLQRLCTQKSTFLIKNNNGGEAVQEVNQLMRESIAKIDSIYKQEVYQEGSLHENAIDRVNFYKQVEANPEIARGVLTGFSEFDLITNGLHGGELMIVGGSSGTGKSIILHNIATNAYLGKYDPLQEAPKLDDTFGGCNILYFSLEMPLVSQQRRIDACMAGVSYRDIRDGKLSPEDKAKYFKVLKFQKNYSKRFHIVDLPRGATVREIELKLIEQKETYGIDFDLIVIDYLGIMKSGSQQVSDWLNLGYISEELHELARTYNIPLLTASQVNRSKDPTKQIYSTDRIARSDMIPSNANVIIQIGNRGDDESTRLDMPIYITKNRDNEIGSFVLMKEFVLMRVRDLVSESFGEEDDDDI